MYRFCLLMYVLFSLGLATSIHYCGNRVESIGLAFAENTCCCGASEQNVSCCSNKVVQFEFDSDYHISPSSQSQLVDQALFSTDIVAPQKLTPSFVKLFRKLVPRLDLPPPKTGLDFRLSISSLVFYG